MSEFDLAELKDSIERESQFIHDINTAIRTVIIGQDDLIEKLLLAILTDGHVFLEGVPGLAKTLTINSLAKIIDTKFQRLQFTPDLLPADILGTLIYNPRDGSFEVKKGPIFANIILADEINRSPAKVQSALLEAMQERQITIGDQTFKLENPFLVMATQNPIEQEGTYPLPEAQVDRFMFNMKIDYPSKEEERTIMKRMAANNGHAEVQKIIESEVLLKAQEAINSIYIDNNLEDYILNLVAATRNPATQNLPKLANLIQYGASPRASIFLHRLSRAYAFMQGRGFVVPQDIKSIGFDVLRHRVILTYEAEAENICTDDVLQQIFDTVEVP